MPNPAPQSSVASGSTGAIVVTRELARRHLLNKTKPPGSLGALEHWAEKLMLVQQTLRPTVSRTLVILFAADNGLASVSAYPRSVTREMLRNVAEGGAAINCLCRAHGIDLRVMDLGVDLPSASTRYEAVDHFRLTNAGTADPRLGEPAMDETVFSFVMGHGRKALQAAAGEGVQVVGVGELGIGNTAVASVLLAAATGEPADRTTGAGTGVVGQRFVEKCQAVQAAVDLWKARGVVPPNGYYHHSDSDSDSKSTSSSEAANWSQVLRALGDLEITAMSTLIHEAATTSSRTLVVVDGFITQVALLYAMLMYPDVIPAIVQHTLLAHVSAEKPQMLLLETLRNVALRHLPEDQVKEWTTPVGNWGMRLGEGSGAALVIPMLKSAAAIATEMATFEAAGVSTEKQD
ncbi:nicotinate-nucleotide-dimethylbenzimidazole phosphoribosyltransferase-like protein [Catenaria anguillulae PL171]|uniref:Nicotinate-nucleotide--dimethylbenzimidazole phosphoribosyltransferase n=1 Tax=Catenaria anguillulae PL171 TaxID=765915 RepID=A0A1Y2HHH3_9FUNG|nr:nicotinate-nucleotide-dimethylbenzimidazole phosphoribosyltransferase-like protein [Catenaria anguillulae PL171]